MPKTLMVDPGKDALVATPWQGNVRELDHALGRAILRASTTTVRGDPLVIGPEHILLDPARDQATAPRSSHVAVMGTGSKLTLREAIELTKRTMVMRTVHESGGNWTAAARALGMSRGNLHHMAKRLGPIDTRPLSA